MLIITILFIGCIKLDNGKSEATKKKEEALKYLGDLYNKEFVIKKVRYINMNKVWEMTVAPKDNKDLEFKVRTGGTFGNQILSNYARIKLSHQSKGYYEPILEEIFGRKMYFYSNMGTYAELEGGNIPPFKELLKNNSEKTLVNIYIYI